MTTTATIIFIGDELELVFEPDTDPQVVEEELQRIKKEVKEKNHDKYGPGPYVHTHEGSVYKERKQIDDTNH